MMATTTMTSEGLRSYLRAMRIGHGLTHQQMGEQVGRSWRTWLSFEMGDTKDLKAPVFQKAIEALQVPPADLEELKAADAQTGKALALQRLNERRMLTDVERAAIEQASVVALPRNTQRVVRLMEILQHDPGSMNRWIGYGEALSEGVDLPEESQESH